MIMIVDDDASVKTACLGGRRSPSRRFKLAFDGCIRHFYY
jgi:hypothetical protein